MIGELIAAAEEEYEVPSSRSEFARQMAVTALRLLLDGRSTGDLLLVNSAMKELRHAMRVFAPYEHVRKVAVFGSARTPRGHPDWVQAERFSEAMAREGWMIITGAGSGIMEAAQGGAGREQSFGVNIRLPFEQGANEVIAGDAKCIHFRYFFTRKVAFVKNSHAIVLFPGGFGTHDEGYEALTLIQTGKAEIVPVVYIDEPGGSYWKDWDAYVRSHLHKRGLISEADLSLYTVTDSPETAVEVITKFYRNYHSSRYVRSKFVIRLRHAPDASMLASLNREFGDILESGEIEISEALEAEADDAPGLPRLILAFDRRSVGRLRQLVDRLNEIPVPEEPAIEASPPEIVSIPLSEEAEREELEEV